MRNTVIATSLTILMAAASLSGAVAADSSKSFVDMAIQGDIAEIKAGQLAEKDGASSGVRKFGANW